MWNGLSERLVAGIAAQNEAAIAACLTDDVQFRALVPPATVGDRLHISYRFTGVEDGEPYTVEQHLFCSVRGGKIERADLLCSGFRPRATG